MLKDIGKTIRKQRKILGYSIEQLAEYSETSFSTISRIELGKLNDIHLSTLNRILNALNLKIDIITNSNHIPKEEKELINYIDSLPYNSQKEITGLLLHLLTFK